MIKFDLNNRIAVVTGGAQGFGLAITERFIEAGAKVVIWDIDESAAKDALKNKDIAGAALDVFATEPLDSKSELFDLDNVLISPHISGNFSSYQDKMIIQFGDFLNKFLNNKTIKNRVCKKRLY